MKKTILQHCTVEQKELLDLGMNYNLPYCLKCGFDHVKSDMQRRLPDKPIYYEKIGYINEMLPKLEEGSLVVWADADTLFLKDESIEHALPPGGIMGMVRTLHGAGGLQPRKWWNIGVVVMKNVHLVRDFFKRVAARNEANDEWAAMAELKEQGWMIGNGIGLSSLDYKWNCWKNNAHVCKDPNFVSWHGYQGVEKLMKMQEFIAKSGKKPIVTA